MVTGRRQVEEFVRQHRDAVSLLPVARFRVKSGGKVECVLCGRDGYGVIAYDPACTFPVQPRGHRVLLAFIDDVLMQVEGPDTAPAPPRLKPWWMQFSRWQIACMRDHPWTCSCGLSFVSYVDLWRHIGYDRPRGWGRQEPPHHEPKLACLWPRAVA